MPLCKAAIVLYVRATSVNMAGTFREFGTGKTSRSIEITEEFESGTTASNTSDAKFTRKLTGAGLGTPPASVIN